MSWKQRLYAFLLRRVLGPYLAEESLQSMHESLNVSLTDGRFLLNNVSLNAAYLTEKTGIRVVQATIRRLQIQMQLRESSQSTGLSANATETAGYTTMAWRAMQLGSSSTVSLVATVQVAGIAIVLGPGLVPKPTSNDDTEEDVTRVNGTTENPKPTAKQSTGLKDPPGKSSGMIASYVDAALASLKLSLSLRDVKVRVLSRHVDEGKATNDGTTISKRHYVELRLASVNYRDSLMSPTDTAGNRLPENEPLQNQEQQQQRRQQQSMQKRLDFGGVFVETGDMATCSVNDNGNNQDGNDDKPLVEGAESDKVQKTLVGRLSAGGEVVWMVSHHPVQPVNVDNRTIESDANDTTNNYSVQQDIEVRIHPQLQVSVDHESIQRVLVVAESFQVQDDLETELEPPPVTLVAIDENDEQDVKVVRGIMEQYLEARHLAEQNQLRGGLLLPANEGTYGNEDDSMSFDAFFDANDQSFANYKSVLEESLVMSRTGSIGGGETERIQTQIKLHLGECSLKLSFLPENHIRQPQTDYILCSFGDLNTVTSVSSSGSAVSASVGHWEIEASHVFKRGGRPEIVSLLHFDSDDDMMNQNVVSLAPCFDLQVEISKRENSRTTDTKIDLRLQPMHILGHPTTVRKAKELVSSIQTGQDSRSSMTTSRESQGKSVAGSRKKARKGKMSLSVWSPSIEAMVPLESSQDHDLLFRRCGYELGGARLSQESFVGIALEDVVLSDESDGHKLACQRALVFAVAPQSVPASRMVEMMRVDVLALSGLQPIYITHRSLAETKPVPPSNTTANSTTGSLSTNAPRTTSATANSTMLRSSVLSPSQSFFPKFPAVSTFKARQEDDDYHDEFSEEIVNALKLQNPQSSMVRLADECTELLEVHIPDVTIDMTKSELEAFLAMVKGAASKLSSSSSSSSSPSSTTTTSTVDMDNTVPASKAISVKLDQITLCFHQETSVSDPASFKLIGSRWELCAVMHSGSFGCIRTAAHSMDLYYAQDLLQPNPTSKADLTAQPIQDRCNAIRHRTVRRNETTAIPVIYRSQLFSPLSPESPALQLDVVSKQRSGKTNDLNVFFTAYNLTHRLDIDSEWMVRLKALISGTKPTDKAHTTGKEDDEGNAENERSHISTHSTEEFPADDRIIKVSHCRCCKSCGGCCGRISVFVVSRGVPWFCFNLYQHDPCCSTFHPPRYSYRLPTVMSTTHRLRGLTEPLGLLFGCRMSGCRLC